MMKMRKAVMGLAVALLLTGTLGFAAKTEVKAEERAITNPFTITKKLQMDENVNNYPAFKFTFQVDEIDNQSKLDELNLGAIDGVGSMNTLIVIDSVPQVSSEPSVQYDGKTPGVVDNKLETITKTVDIDFASLKFTQPGYYLYKVTEAHLSTDGSLNDWTPISDTDKLISQSKEEYVFAVAVVAGDTGALSVDNAKSFIVHKGDNAWEKSKAEFVNVYQRGKNPPEIPDDKEEDCDLKIEKQVTGEFGDSNKKFDFSLTLHKNATDTVTKYTAQKYDSAGSFNGIIEFTVDEKTSFTLKHGEYLKFEDFPVGSSYEIKETGNEGYTTTADVYENGKKKPNQSEGIFEMTTYTIGEKRNYMQVINDKGGTVATGIVTDNLSVIMLMGVSVAGLAAYFFFAKRRSHIHK